jgi:hypothetical protein
VAIDVEINKVADDDRLARYSFVSSDGSERSLMVDREDERLWPDDGVENIEYNGAARALVRAWRQQGEPRTGHATKRSVPPGSDNSGTRRGGESKLLVPDVVVVAAEAIDETTTSHVRRSSDPRLLASRATGHAENCRFLIP